MARKPRQTRKEKLSTIPAALLKSFTGVPYGADDEGAADVFLMELTPRMKDAWDSWRDEIMPDWTCKHPCSRPAAWWDFDAPGPRRRLGGTGDPASEHLAYGEAYSYGLPDTWITKFDEEYYNGRRLDIHGKLIPTPYKDGDFQGKAVDPEDPPTFESQAAYLERHGLLTAYEKKWLEGHKEALEPETITCDDD